MSTAGGHALMMYTKFKIVYAHLASYPKIFYLPLMLFACGVYGYHSVKKSSVPYDPQSQASSVENPFADLQSFKKWLTAGMVSLVGEITGSKYVQKEGISYLERMFKNKQVHDSLLVLLKGGVRDSRFIGDSKGFGIDWI